MLTADIISIVTGGLVLSVLHALIPNHWVPVLAISRSENWSLNETTLVMFLSGLAHAVSTVLIGFAIGFAGLKLADSIEIFTEVIAPGILILLGMFFIYKHHNHTHVHVSPDQKPETKKQLLLTLVIMMLLSPCLEIQGYFLLAGAHGWPFILLFALFYTVITVAGMIIWIRIAYAGLKKFSSQDWEFNAGVITGVILIASGIISILIH